MYPTLAPFGVEVSSYVVLLTVALVAGVAVARASALRAGWSPRDVLFPSLAGIAGGLAGAPLWSLLFELRPMRVAAGSEIAASDLLAAGGLSVMGGLALGALGAYTACSARRLSFVAWIDVAAPGVAVSIAIGRIGCLLAGCCHGRPTLFPIAIVYDDWNAAARPIGVPLHATQLYESAGAALLAALLWFTATSPTGRRAGWLFVGYGLLRGFVETLRGDYRGWTLGLPTTQLAALTLVALGVCLITIGAFRPHAFAGYGTASMKSPRSA